MSVFSRKNFLCALVIASFVTGASAFAQTAPELEVVAELNDRPANIAVAVDGQIIVSMHPFDKPLTKLIQIKKDGSTEPFPTKEWNESPNSKGIGFSNVIGIRATPNRELMVLDMGDKTHSARMVVFDLRSTSASAIRFIPQDFLTEQSFLQDFAYDWDKKRFLIADMGQADLSGSAHPALIDLDLNSGWVRRLLPDLPEFMPPEKPLEVDGKVLTFEKDGQKIPVRAALNSITIDPQMDWLYFAPMGEGKLYRVPTSKLTDPVSTKDDIMKRVEVVCDKKPASDGITVDSAGNVYIAAVGRREIGVITPDGDYKPYIKDERLDWVDGFSFGPDGYVYATISRLDRAELFNKARTKARSRS